jgi:hypothetical protein
MMSYQLVIGGEDFYDLASVGGWRDFKAWIKTLPKKTYSELYVLADDALSQRLDDLTEQLAKAIDRKPPDDGTILATAQALLKTLQGRNREHESAFITDGIVEDDDPDFEEDWVVGDDDDEEEGEVGDDADAHKK